MSRRRIVLAIVLPVTVLLGAGATLGALAVDGNARRHLPSGAFIQGVDVGGATVEQAEARVRDRVEAPLHQPVKLAVDAYAIETTPWDLGYRVDVARAVRQAMSIQRGGTVASRVASRLLGSAGAPFLELRPSWGPGALDGVLAGAAKAVASAPRDADIDVTSGWVRVVPEKAGKALDLEASKRSVMDGVALGDSSVRLVARPVKADPDPAVSKVILVRAGENRLYLYDNGQIVKSWPVATGAAGYLTPVGLWRVTQKIVNPSWYNPGSAWAKGLPAVIGPGPGNPLGTRAMALDAPAILIHATSNSGSIGYSESHGCIRMNEADEAELFSMVPVGIRVAVVQVTPPRPKGSAPIDQTAY